MAALSINFTPVAGIASYRVCYNPADSVDPPTCITVTGSPVEIIEGITCGVRYDVSVYTLCPEGYASGESSAVTVQTLALECGEPTFLGTCYTIEIPYESLRVDEQNLHIHYEDADAGYLMQDATTMLSFDTGSGVAIPVCSVSGEPNFRYGSTGYDEIPFGITVTMGNGCNNSNECNIFN